jgi:two-component system, chemotaxis family, protein-glutamate methylesterase/glutaminase
VVCVGASAGGVDALRAFVGGFDSSFAGAVFVVLHLVPSAGSALDRILARAGALRSIPAADGQAIEPGSLYVARPDHHLILSDGRVRLGHGPRENGVRPAIDPLFRSAADAYGPRSVGVVLSGTGDDGTAGLAAIKAAGGMALAQDPGDAAYREMPARAIESVEVDVVGTPEDLSTAAQERTAAIGDPGAAPIVALAGGAKRMPSEFTCPDCGGTLFEHVDGGVERFVCRVGHAYSPKSLLEQHDENLENVLWSAVRAFEERADLARRMMNRLGRAGLERAADRYRVRVDEAERHGEQLRGFLLHTREEVADG